MENSEPPSAHQPSFLCDAMLGSLARWLRFFGYDCEYHADLDDADQDTYLKSREHTEFFETVRFKTLAGVFGLNSWGGNQDNVGWKIVGMDGPPHAWLYPFGYYDAEYVKEQQNGE